MSYVIILVIFVVVVLVIQKSQKKSLGNMAAQAQTSDPFKKMSEHFGFQYEAFTPSSEKNILYSSGTRITGTYQDIPVEIVYAMSTQSESELSRFAASYTMQKTVSFEVQNPHNKQLSIVPRSLSAEGGTPTGNAAFDANLQNIGNISLPTSFVEYCGNLGWMHVVLSGNKLVFHDTFYDQFKGVSGSMQMMSVVHPIWKSTVSHNEVNLESAKQFFDQMVVLAKSL